MLQLDFLRAARSEYVVTGDDFWEIASAVIPSSHPTLTPSSTSRFHTISLRCLCGLSSNDAEEGNFADLDPRGVVTGPGGLDSGNRNLVTNYDCICFELKIHIHTFKSRDHRS
jgi:hypothetical protein